MLYFASEAMREGENITVGDFHSSGCLIMEVLAEVYLSHVILRAA